MECFASNHICCLLSLSVNGTQVDRDVLINVGCSKTWSWNLCGMELRTKGGRERQARVRSCGNQEGPCGMLKITMRINLEVKVGYI